ncbi:MAG: HEAT repeat domain-containing protein [Ignavibacteriaceae bacterium]
MTYYCISCWKEIKAEVKICPNCGLHQDQLEKENFVKKLIRALNHPESETPVRAANILSKLNAVEAVPALLKRLTNENDPFIIEAVVDAILKLQPDLKSQLKKLFKNNIPVTIKNVLE